MSTYAERQSYRDAHPGVVVDNNSSSDGGFQSSTPNGTPSSGGGGGSSGGGGGGGSPAPAPQPAPTGGQPTYQTKNGPKTVDQMYAELQAAGWPGPPAGTLGPGSIANAYQQTTGGQVTEMSGQSYGAAAQPASSPTSAAASGNGSDNADVLAKLGQLQQQMVNAVASGNKAAFDETVREFNATFGLDQQKYQTSVDQYNKSFGLQQAGVTGTYNGQPTEQARQFNLTNGLSALQLASTNQADPFRRLQTQYAIGQNPDYMSGMRAVVNGVTGANGVAQQQAPGVSAADSATLGGLVGSVAGTQGPNGTYQQGQAVLNGLPAPNQTIARNFNTLSPTAQDAYLSAQAAKTGMDPADLKAQIASTLPRYTAPSFGLSAI